jgi:hypothetical protein
MRLLALLFVALVGLLPSIARAQDAATAAGDAGAPTVIPIPPPPPLVVPPQVPTLAPPADLAGLAGRPVTRVAVVLEGNVWDDVAVPALSSLSVGAALTPAGARAALHELLATGRFARGRITAQEDGAGVAVTLRVVPRKLIDRLQVDIHGARLDLEELLRVAGLSEGGEIVGADLEPTTESLERTFNVRASRCAIPTIRRKL